MTDSPFQTSRFEYEGQHLYFLPKHLVDVLEIPKHNYIIGSRGTGKTTLLKALNWDERLNNNSLKRQLGSNVFAKRCIGAYLKLPEHRFESLNEKIQEENKEIGCLLTSIYIDILGLQPLIDAITELIALKIIAATPKEEQNCTSAIIEDFANWFQSIVSQWSSKQPTTLKNLNKLFRQIQLNIERYAVYGGNAEQAICGYSGQFGQLGRSVASRLGDLCNISIPDSMDKWYFKICMDEGECLSRNDLLVLNTMTRLSKWPLFHAICFVDRPDDISSTLIPNLSLSDADREMVLLEDMTDKEFRILGEGVATVRVQELLKDYSVDFKSSSCLGKLSINRILTSVLAESTSRKAKELLYVSRERLQEPIFSEWIRRQSVPDDEDEIILSETTENMDDTILPIYETYLVQQLNLKLPTPEEPQWAKRAQASAEIRKKMVAAYLSICAEMGMDVRYASADMVFQMSDKCIRDFLNFIHEIFLESNNDLRGFMKKLVPLKVQDKAIKRASLQKKDSLKRSGILSPTEAGRIIEALAKITEYIQTKSPDGSHLEAIERGKFTLSIKPSERDIFDPVLKLIRDAAQAGFLFISQEGESKWKFRVHTSLAAYYGFSYRGAYYETPLDIKELDLIRQCYDLEEYESLVQKMSKRLAGWKQEIGDLFDEY